MLIKNNENILLFLVIITLLSCQSKVEAYQGNWINIEDSTHMINISKFGDGFVIKPINGKYDGEEIVARVIDKSLTMSFGLGTLDISINDKKNEILITGWGRYSKQEKSGDNYVPNPKLVGRWKATSSYEENGEPFEMEPLNVVLILYPMATGEFTIDDETSNFTFKEVDGGRIEFLIYNNSDKKTYNLIGTVSRDFKLISLEMPTSNSPSSDIDDYFTIVFNKQ